MKSKLSIDDEENLEPSELDDLTHAEMLALYQESARTILFAKTRQWATLGGICIVQLALVLIGTYIVSEQTHLQALIILSFLISSFAAAILIIYQLWQHTEALKVRQINQFMSGQFRLVRKVKSRLEANIHRYILFMIMIGTILVANSITYMSLIGHLVE